MKIARQLDLIDNQTGEVMNGRDGKLVWQRNDVPSPFQRWLAVSQNVLEALARSRHDLGLDARAVLDCVMGRLDFENYIHISQIEIAKLIDMRKQHVSRAFKKLIDLQILVKGPRVGRVITYRLNPNFGWRGTTTKHREAIQAALPLKLVPRPQSMPMPAEIPAT